MLNLIPRIGNEEKFAKIEAEKAAAAKAWKEGEKERLVGWREKLTEEEIRQMESEDYTDAEDWELR